MEAGAWFGLFTPAATPPAAAAWINSEAKKAFDAPDIRERFARQGCRSGRLRLSAPTPRRKPSAGAH
jgi:tripartite-type tricarboxylate transporter receptor subunit TctC